MQVTHLSSKLQALRLELTQTSAAFSVSEGNNKKLREQVSYSTHRSPAHPSPAQPSPVLV